MHIFSLPGLRMQDLWQINYTPQKNRLNSIPYMFGVMLLVLPVVAITEVENISIIIVYFGILYTVGIYIVQLNKMVWEKRKSNPKHTVITIQNYQQVGALSIQD